MRNVTGALAVAKITKNLFQIDESTLSKHLRYRRSRQLLLAVT